MVENGSVQNIPEIPEELKALYKTVWELSQKEIIDQAADRGAFICQSQSLNLFVENPSFAKLSSMHFYGWQKGLKTGMYYLRSKAAVDPIKFTLSAKHQKKYVDSNETTNDTTAIVETNEETMPDGEVCNMDDGCLMCGS